MSWNVILRIILRILVSIKRVMMNSKKYSDISLRLDVSCMNSEYVVISVVFIEGT